MLPIAPTQTVTYDVVTHMLSIAPTQTVTYDVVTHMLSIAPTQTVAYDVVTHKALSSLKTKGELGACVKPFLTLF